MENAGRLYCGPAPSPLTPSSLLLKLLAVLSRQLCAVQGVRVVEESLNLEEPRSSRRRVLDRRNRPSSVPDTLIPTSDRMRRMVTCPRL